MSNNISTSITRVGVGVAILCGLVLSSIQIFLDYQDQQQRNEEVINTTLKIASAGATQAAYELSATEAVVPLQALMIEEHTLAAQITNEKGDILGSFNRAADPEKSSFLLRALMTEEQVHTVNLFHIQSNMDVGELRIVVHTPTLMQGFFSRSVRQLIAGVIRTLIVMTALLFVFNRMLTRPITEFAAKLDKVDPRAPQAVELPKSIAAENNELSELALATNAILSASQDNLTEIEKTRRETEELNIKLQHSERLSIVGKLTGGVAHDFNNILAVIMGSFELLQHGKQLDAEGEQLVETGLKATKHGARLTTQLLAYSRRQSLNPKPIEIRRLLLSIEKLLKQVLGKNCEFSLSFGDEIWHCFADERQLETALLNLAINAKDAIDIDGTFTIDARNTFLDMDGNENSSSPTGFVRITITDNGTGMSEEALQNAFEPYFTTKPAGQGSGLGLSMVHGFVNQSGGHINIDSHEGQGTSIVIFLPRHNQKLMTTQNMQQVADINPSPSAGKKVSNLEEKLNYS